MQDLYAAMQARRGPPSSRQAENSSAQTTPQSGSGIGSAAKVGATASPNPSNKPVADSIGFNRIFIPRKVMLIRYGANIRRSLLSPE
jgi:hypothetical protein